jgi:septal ring factor EnvC (AmiA/AmiB activator)
LKKKITTKEGRKEKKRKEKKRNKRKEKKRNKRKEKKNGSPDRMGICSAVRRAYCSMGGPRVQIPAPTLGSSQILSSAPRGTHAPF